MSSPDRGRGDLPGSRAEPAATAAPGPAGSCGGRGPVFELARSHAARACASRGHHEESLHLVQLQELGGQDARLLGRR